MNKYLENVKCLICGEQTVYLDFSDLVDDIQDTAWANQLREDFGLERLERKPRYQCDYCGSYWWDKNGRYINE